MPILTALRWWLAHWILNGFVSFPLVIASWIKGANASGSGPMNHHKVGKVYSVICPVSDSARPMQKIGTIVFSLYIVQIVLGAFVHFIRIPFPLIVNRPLSNYVHALLGLTILAMSAYQVCRQHVLDSANLNGFGQVHHGLYVQWPMQTGNQYPITLSEKHAWLALVIVSHVQGYLYLGH
jgi:peptidoglycan/LPS O-acetylase OafA/YrhL